MKRGEMFFRQVGKGLMVLLFLFGLAVLHVHAEWIQLDGGGVPTESMACTYDRIRHRGVMFGGGTGGAGHGSISSNTYEWDGASWTLVTSNGPSRRVNSAMAFDTRRGKAVLFGGWVTPDNYYGDTWEWDGTQWNLVSTSGPPPRANHAMAYDSSRRKIVLFGGSYYQTIYGDTWEWDGSSWRQVSSSGPCPRIFARMVYDESRGKVVLFGGQTHYYGTFLSDTWEWDGNSWQQVATTGPSARSYHMMAYDPIRQRVVLFGGGGWDRPEYFDDTWEWDGTSWTQIDEYGPSERARACMFFDESRQTIILFGGYNSKDGALGDTWEYSSISEPSADIKANGSDGPLFITTDESVDITVALDPGAMFGESCDWWIGALTPYGTYWMVDPSLNWALSNSPISLGQYPLFDLPETTILDNFNLPLGHFLFFFILDNNPNGFFDTMTYQDYVDVVVFSDALESQANKR